MRTYAQLTTSFVVFCNRVGVDESISFWGGSEVIAPSGQPLFSAPFFEEGVFTVDVSLSDVRRERVALPLLRDERPELEVRELSRIVAERAGMAEDSTADDRAEPGLDVAPGDPIGQPIGFRARKAGGR
jgi:Carbon-nitrogen hydrolase